jgi:2-oxoacid:acceptor oxidoreductase delta subunit (pyruvate/2-ketoisovalerate family)
VVVLPGTAFSLPADLVITAVGQLTQEELIPERIRGAEGLVVASKETGETVLRSVFAGGDAVSGPATVVQAVGAGQRAAGAIDRFLTGELVELSTAHRHPVKLSDLNLSYFSPQKRRPEQLASVRDRLNRQDVEVTATFQPDDTVFEAARCFSCGVCNSCDNCWLFCPDMSISRGEDGYSINYDYCKGCGICVLECPRNAMAIDEEMKCRK